MSDEQCLPTDDDENKLIAERRAKLDKLRERGRCAFPNDFRRDALADQLLTAYGDRPTGVVRQERRSA